jgi:putative spermidine/putrescine transport system permease protein
VTGARATRIGLVVWTILVVLFLWIPLVVIGIYAFNSSNIQDWPIDGFSVKWFGEAWNNPEVHDAFILSLKAGFGATGIALVLGTALAFALHRFRFFGRDTISFLFVLPIALPGIVTGMSLNRFFDVAGVNLSLWTIVIGHATFCMVIVFNNVVARLRRTSATLIEASQDLGADGWQTFRYVTWPTIATALVAGGLLAFALSFDEVVVTYFTAGSNNTLPLIIFGYIREGLRLPVVNVVVLVVILLTVVPVMISVRLTRDTGILKRS